MPNDESAQRNILLPGYRFACVILLARDSRFQSLLMKLARVVQRNNSLHSQVAIAHTKCIALWWKRCVVCNNTNPIGSSLQNFNRRINTDHFNIVSFIRAASFLLANSSRLRPLCCLLFCRGSAQECFVPGVFHSRLCFDL